MTFTSTNIVAAMFVDVNVKSAGYVIQRHTFAMTV